MHTPKGTPVDGQAPDERLKDLPTWADRYARNRTLPALLYLGLFFFGVAVFSLLGSGMRIARDAGQTTLAGVLGVLTLLAVIGWLWSIASGNLVRLVMGLSERYYRREGVAISTSGGRPRETWRSWVLGLAVLTVPLVGWMLPVDIQYAQPIVACYIVPLLLWWTATDGRVTRPMGLLWPGLYALHAVAMLLGAPLTLGDASQTVIWPLMVYLLVALLAGHIYSRQALRRMREISRGTAEEREDE